MNKKELIKTAAKKLLGLKGTALLAGTGLAAGGMMSTALKAQNKSQKPLEQ